MDLLTFLQENDPSPPDFIDKMVTDGKCRTLCRMYPNSLEESEIAILKERRWTYYKEAAWKILLKMIPCRRPTIPLADTLGVESFYEAINLISEDPSSKVWLYMDFIKAGKNSFVVKTPESSNEPQKKARYYTHKFLSSQRSEDLTP